MLPYILGAILLLILIIIFIPVGLRIKYDGDFSLYAVIGFVKIRLIPKKTKVRVSDYSVKKMKKQAEKAEKKDEKSKKKSAAAKKEKPDNVLTASLKDPDRRFKMLEQLYDIITVVLNEFSAILTFKLVKIRVIVGSPEAATTAIIYGGACAAAGNLVNLLSQYTDIKKSGKNSIYVAPDFTAEKTTASADVAVKLCVGGLIVFLIKIRKIIKQVLELLKEDKTNG